MPTAKQRRRPSAPPPSIPPLLATLRHLVEHPTRWSSPAAPLTELYDLLARLRLLQASSAYYRTLVPARTSSSLDAFADWIHARLGTSSPPFRLAFVDKNQDNATLYATRPIAKDDVFVSVPEACILKPDRAARSPTSALLQAVPALASMPSLTLILQLLLEADNPSSAYAPYIGVLPSSFSIPLTIFSVADILALAPSRASEAAIRTLRATVRDYTHIYTLLQRNRIPSLSLALLSWENYTWATAVAMTRQNDIPSGDKTLCALVPIWDMCNHAPGPATTSVGISEEEGVVVESRAMRNFDEGDDISMSYGQRGNVDLLLYSGFVQAGNEYDRVPLDLQLTDQMELAKFKAQVVLGKVGMAVEQLEEEDGWIVPLSVGKARESTVRALAVARVMAAGKKSVGALLKGGEELMRKPLGVVEEEERAKGIVREAAEKRLDQYKETCGDGVAAELITKLHEEETSIYRQVLAFLDG